MSFTTSLLCLALALPLAGCGRAEDELVNVESFKEANGIVVALARGGFPGVRLEEEVKRRSRRYSVRVPRERLTAARALIHDLELPRARRPAYDRMSGEGSWTPDAVKERELLRAARQEKLENGLLAYERILTVHVVLAIYDPGLRGDLARHAARNAEREAERRPKAGVLLRYREGGEEPPLPLTVEDIQAYVANGVAGLSADDVVVTLTPVAMPPLPAAAAPPGDPSRVTVAYALGLGLGICMLVVTGLWLRARRLRPVGVRGIPAQTG